MLTKKNTINGFIIEEEEKDVQAIEEIQENRKNLLIKLYDLLYNNK